MPRSDTTIKPDLTPGERAEVLAALEQAGEYADSVAYAASCGVVSAEDMERIYDRARMAVRILSELHARLSPSPEPAIKDCAEPSDTAMLDWLESRRVALNDHYKTEYGWEIVRSHNVTRLFVQSIAMLDVNDARANGEDIRTAIRAVMKGSVATEPASKQGASLVPNTTYDRRELDRVISMAHGLGWNGVDNSKILSVFLGEYIGDLEERARRTASLKGTL